MKCAGTFNAGCGSALKIKKRVEIEAFFKDVRTLQAGAAGLLSDIQKSCAFSQVNN
jgi:isoaspartyl peptidase/L-asparaginase-like protein (Ntn-hydrolase superfamily)